MLYEILLKRLLGVIAPTFKDLSTVLIQAKIYLNFHPLSALSNDQNDLTRLSPRHLLIGASLMCFPEPNLSALFCQTSVQVEAIVKVPTKFWEWFSTY